MYLPQVREESRLVVPHPWAPLTGVPGVLFLQVDRVVSFFHEALPTKLARPNWEVDYAMLALLVHTALSQVYVKFST